MGTKKETIKKISDGKDKVLKENGYTKGMKQKISIITE